MTRYRGAERAGPGELLVSEVFGPTLQGEGPSAGRAAVFVRLGMCNLACSWCDSSHTWDGSRHDLRQELRRAPVADVVSDVLSRRARLVVVTGGEPLLQRDGLVGLVRALAAAGRRVELETSGTVDAGRLAGLAHRFVVSPKLANSGQPARRRLRWDVLGRFAALATADFKFVVASPADLPEVEGIAGRLGLGHERVWVMPEGTEAESVTEAMRRLAPGVCERGWSLSGRIHVLLWGDERGR